MQNQQDQNRLGDVKLPSNISTTAAAAFSVPQSNAIPHSVNSNAAIVTPQPASFSRTPVKDRLPIGINGCPPSFNIASKLRGVDEVNLNYIRGKSCARVHLRGIGSGYFEPGTNRELNEPLFFDIRADSVAAATEARKLLANLVETTKSELRAHLAQLAAPKLNAAQSWQFFQKQ